MIPVARTAAPNDFEDKVGNLGRVFLRETPNPTTNQYNNHNYWVKVKGDLYDDHNGVCAYSCHFISRVTGNDTVEHFVPKSADPTLAYVWENYRLVCGRFNGRKGTYQDVLDPFEIDEGMFVLKFPSLLIKPAEHLNQADTIAVDKSITRLKLNDDEKCVEARVGYVLDFCRGDITFRYLENKAPFIALELERQDLIETISEIMSI